MSLKLETFLSPLLIFLCLNLVLFNVDAKEVQQRYTPDRYNIYTSEKHNFVWFRVFKVASFTIKSVLSNHVSDLKQYRPRTIPKKFNRHFKFAFVRNSWDRVVSCYLSKVVTKKAPDFKECFNKDFDYFVDYINKLDLKRANCHLKLQTELLPADECDFIGRLDNFANDFKHVCDVIGITCDLVPHKHKIEHPHYSTYYTPRTRDIIAKKYKKDIKTFGFTFEAQ